jgi:hypothetical protein
MVASNCIVALLLSYFLIKRKQAMTDAAKAWNTYNETINKQNKDAWLAAAAKYV